MSEPLDFSQVPHLPQRRTLIPIAEAFWSAPGVIALWLGGSFGRGAADLHSDVDLGVAMAPEADRSDVLPAVFRAQTVVLQHTDFSPELRLYQAMLHDGGIYDVVVQPCGAPLMPERRLVLGSRDPEVAARLLAEPANPRKPPGPAEPHAMRGLIESFWFVLPKHAKVVRRGLHLLAWDGDHRMKTELLRLYYALATGNDCGPIPRLNIHGMTPVVRAVQDAFGGAPLRVLGSPVRELEEIQQSATVVADEVARAGGEIAQKLGFEYPAAAEAAARSFWQAG